MSPMWLTSNTPTPPRTALCSAIKPPLEGYSTGISQPPKLTIFAPNFLWSAFSGVFRSSVWVEEFTESIPLAQAEIDGSTRYKVRQRRLPRIRDILAANARCYCTPARSKCWRPCRHQDGCFAGAFFVIEVQRRPNIHAERKRRFPDRRERLGAAHETNSNGDRKEVPRDSGRDVSHHCRHARHCGAQSFCEAQEY